MPAHVNKLVHEANIQAKEENKHQASVDIQVPATAHMSANVQWPIQTTINKGLEGAIATETKIGYVDGVNGRLVYRGYDCFDLAEKSSFEETSYLLLFGELPTKKQLEEFDEELKNYRYLPDEVINAMKLTSMKNTHPMIDLYMGVALLAGMNESTEDKSIENQTLIAKKLISRMTSVTGAIARLRQGKDPVKPDNSLSLAGNLIYVMTGKKPDAEMERIMDIALILHADHGMNASTFASMVTNSTLSDMYSSIVSGIATLKGPLHGGANERVLYDLEEIGTPDKAVEWFKKARQTKRKVMGFGHRVYKAYDPRARIFRPLAGLMAERKPELKNLYETALELDNLVTSELGKEKKIFPNVDFYSGLVYKAMGIDTQMFTPIFAASRISGWTARVLEYLKENRIFRPKAAYTGVIERGYTEIEKRT